METHPPDMAVLARAIDGLTDQIAAMRAELSEIRRISSLTEITLKSYFRVSQSPNPEGHEGHVREMNQSPQCQGKDRQKPPLVPEGERVTCVRCGYEWSPRARRPHLCPGCKTPWWFAARWKWRRKTGAPQESGDDG